MGGAGLEPATSCKATEAAARQYRSRLAERNSARVAVGRVPIRTHAFNRAEREERTRQAMREAMGG